MELTVQKGDLLHELQLCQGIVERKNTIPILGNVLLEANDDGSVRLLATDLEVGLRSQCQASISRAGALTVPAKKLFEIVRALPDTEIRLEAGAHGAVNVSADRFDSRMQTLPREDFPTLPDPGGDGAETVAREALRGMVMKTQFAITGEDTRYFLNGALFVLKPGSMSLIATDGHRLGAGLLGVGWRRRSGRRNPGDPAEEDARRAVAAVGGWGGRRTVHPQRESPVLRDRRAPAHLAYDRRAVPCLRARHSDRKRQAGRFRARSIDQRDQAGRAAVERALPLRSSSGLPIRRRR